MTFPKTVLMIGCGNMGGAMLAGWLRGGSEGGVSPDCFTVVDPRLEAAPEGVRLLRSLPEGEVFDLMLLGVKPQMLNDVAPQLTALAGGQTVVLSILAGAELASLSARFPGARGIVRVMPNLAAALGESPMGVAAQGLSEEETAGITAFLTHLGTPEWVGEDLFHAVTALAGSGPAFVYRIIDALATGGVALGLDPEQALRLARSMVQGAADLAMASPYDPGELARRVASPGGTTQAGLDVLDQDGAALALMQATLNAAEKRSREMAQEAR
jgi:pyrroline-5-carboxylate reductase